MPRCWVRYHRRTRTLEVLRGQQGNDRRAIGPRIATLPARRGTPRSPRAGNAPRAHGRRAILGDENTLATGETILLDHVRGPKASSATEPRGYRRRCASAVGTPAAAMTSLAYALDPSICAAGADGPKQAMPCSRTASATPATSGASGPMTTSSARRCSASAATCAASRDRGRAQDCRPAGRFLRCLASTTAATPHRRLSASTRACSRPPPPTTSTLTTLERNPAGMNGCAAGKASAMAQTSSRPLAVVTGA